MPAVSVRPPDTAIRWITAVGAADYRAEGQTPMGVIVAAAASVVVIDNAGTSMTIDTVGTYYLAFVRLGAVVGTAFILFGG